MIGYIFLIVEVLIVLGLAIFSAGCFFWTLLDKSYSIKDKVTTFLITIFFSLVFLAGVQSLIVKSVPELELKSRQENLERAEKELDDFLKEHPEFVSDENIKN